MRRPLRLRVVQSAPALGDLDANLAAHREAVDAAAADGVGLVVFPELSLTGYGLQDLVDVVALDPGHPRWDDALALSESVDVVVGFVERGADGWLRNAVAYLHDGALLHLHRKTYLPTYGAFDEGRFFVPGDRLGAFDAPWGRTALVVCEETWHPAAAHAAAADGASALIVVANAPGRTAVDGGWENLRGWRRILESYARLYAVGVAFCNRVGWEEGMLFGGASAVWGPDGTRLAEAGFLEPESLDAAWEPAEFRRARVANPAHGIERPELLIEALERGRGR